MIDYSRADPLDPWWHRRHAMLLRGLRRRNEREFLRAEFLADISAALWHLGNQPQLLERAWTQLDEYRDLFRRIQPPTEQEQKQAAATQASRDKGAWQDIYGDLADPAVQARIAAFAEAMEQQREATAKQVGPQSPAFAMLRR